MTKKLEFELHYSNGVRFSIHAESCKVTKRLGAFEKVDFEGCDKWVVFVIDDLVAVVEK